MDDTLTLIFGCFFIGLIVVMWLLVGGLVCAIIETYSDNPVWKLFILCWPIGLVILLLFVIREWFESIVDYFKWR